MKVKWIKETIISTAKHIPIWGNRIFSTKIAMLMWALLNIDKIQSKPKILSIFTKIILSLLT
jgi:hypothetical protein